MRNRRHCTANGAKVGAAVGNLLTAAQKCCECVMSVVIGGKTGQISDCVLLLSDSDSSSK